MDNAMLFLPRIVIMLLSCMGLLYIIASKANEDGLVSATHARIAAFLMPMVVVLYFTAFVLSIVIVWHT